MRRFDYSLLEQKLWGTDILNLVARIHECKGRQDYFLRQKPAELERLTEIAKIQSTEASNKIEGIITSDTRMKQLFQEKTTPRNRAEDEIMGYRDVLNTIHESHEYIPVRPSYMLQLHRDLFAKAGLSYGGHFKNAQNYISGTRADGTVFTIFTPVEPFCTPDAVENLCHAYEQAISGERIDALLLIPSFIIDFLCIHPFNDGNGRMSRLLTLLLLYKSGYEVGKYISIERQIELTKDRYYEVLEESDKGWHEGKNDPIPFVRYMLQVILACYTEFEKRVGMMDDCGSRSRAYDIVKNYVNGKIGKIIANDVIANCPKFGKSTVLREIKRLTDEGLLIKQGSGRSTFYVRSDSK